MKAQIYNIKAENRDFVLKFIIWSMKPHSRLIFSVPNIKKFLVNKDCVWKNQKCVFLEKNKFFIMKEKRSIFKPKSWLFCKKEYWHKTTVKFQ